MPEKIKQLYKAYENNLSALGEKTSALFNKIHIRGLVNSHMDIVKVIAVLVVCTMIGDFLALWGFDAVIIIIFYILGIIYASFLTTKRRWGLLASAGGILLFVWRFVEPTFSFSAKDIHSVWIMIVMFFVSVLTGEVTSRFRRQEREERRRHRSTEVLLHTSRILQQAETPEQMMKDICAQISELIDRDIEVYYVMNGKLSEAFLSSDRQPLLYPKMEVLYEWMTNPNPRRERTVGKPTGKGTYIKSGVQDELVVTAGTLLSSVEELEKFERDLVGAMLDEAVLALEKMQIKNQHEKTKVRAETEKVRADFLRAISHDLRTPLTGLKGNVEILIERDEKLSHEKRLALYNSMYNDTEWLIEMVENLLFVTRIENGAMQLQTEPEFLQELIVDALNHVSRKKSEHEIVLNIEDDMLMADVDSRLISAVIINFVDNAIKYTEPGSKITVSLFERDDKVVLECADNGYGVAEEDKELIFNMFYTTSVNKRCGVRGTGLGLYLCRSIIEAHSGRIYVRDNPGGGAVFGFALPIRHFVNDFEPYEGSRENPAGITAK
ncbi:MAG: DUF4118 domain-containing protein [Firmicutes bacterium]|nr:DUF4118 domain-containing protein [Bacillota bacterium]